MEHLNVESERLRSRKNRLSPTTGVLMATEVAKIKFQSDHNSSFIVKLSSYTCYSCSMSEVTDLRCMH